MFGINDSLWPNISYLKFYGRSDGCFVDHPVPFKVLGVYDYKYNSNKLYIFLSNKFKFDVYLI